MIDQKHNLLDDISDEDVESALTLMDLFRKRANAQIDQLLAELSESWANAYTTKYIKTAGLGTTLAIMDNPDETYPTPVHLVECPTPRHRLPAGVPKVLVEAWRPWMDEDEDGESSPMMALIGGSSKSWIIRKVPIYAPVDAFHRAVNAALVEGQDRFREAALELDRVFEKLDSLARQHNAALFGSLAITTSENDDGSSEITG